MNNGYLKFVVALGQVLVGALIVVTDPFQDGGATITAGEYVWLGEQVLTAVLVVIVPNLDAGAAKYTKAVVTGGLAVLGLVLSLLVDGFQPNDGLLLLTAFLTGAGVWTAKSPQHPTSPAVAAA